MSSTHAYRRRGSTPFTVMLIRTIGTSDPNTPSAPRSDVGSAVPVYLLEVAKLLAELVAPKRSPL